MHGGDRRRGERLERKVAVGHGVERIGGGPREAERLCRHLPVDGEARAGKRRGAQGTLGKPLGGVGEAAAVAREHLDIGEAMMAEGDGLGGLQMGEAGHHGAGVLMRLLGERKLKRGEHARRWRRSRP